MFNSPKIHEMITIASDGNKFKCGECGRTIKITADEMLIIASGDHTVRHVIGSRYIPVSQEVKQEEKEDDKS